MKDNYIYVPNSSRIAGYNIRSALGRRVNQLSTFDFLNAWCSIAYLFPGLSVDGYDEPHSGWPRALRRFVVEACARAEGGELADDQLYPVEAAWCGIYDRMARSPVLEETERRVDSACRYGAPAGV